MHWLRERGGPIERFHQAVLVQAPLGADLDDLGGGPAGGRSTTTTRSACACAATGPAVPGPRCGARTWRRPGSVDAGRPAATASTSPARPATPAALRAVVAREADAAAGRLDPDAGVMVQAVWFDAGADRPGRLLLVAHHLVVDGVSWRILVPDLAAAWLAVAVGDTPAARPGADLAAALVAARSPRRRPSDARLDELDHWLRDARPRRRSAGRRRGRHGGARPRPRPWATPASASSRIDAATTGAVLADVPAAVRAGAEDVVLAALHLAVARGRSRTGDDRTALVVDVEGHGREEAAVDGVARRRRPVPHGRLADQRAPGARSTPARSTSTTPSPGARPRAGCSRP